MYKRTAHQVISRALQLSGIIGVEQPISAIDMSTGIETLNYLLQSWMNEGLRLWTERDAVLFLEKGQRSYFLGDSGDRSCYLSALTNTTITADQTSGNNTIALASVSGISAPSNTLTVDPSVTVTGWTTANDGTLDLSGGFLRVTNGAADNGSAQYTLKTVIGKTYRVDYGYLQGTSADADFSILDADDNALVSANQTASGDYTFDFTATETSHRFEIKNGSAVIGETSQLDKLEFIDLSSGDYISVKKDDGTRFWSTVESISGLTVTMRDNLDDDASSGAIVYSYPQSQQLKRPLNIDDIRYQVDINQNEIPVQKITRNEDRMQPIKTTNGTVTWAYYSPQLDDGQIDVWQRPASSDSLLQFTSIDPAVITVETVDNVEIPAFYLNAVTWGLAAEFITEYNIGEPRASRIERKAAIEYEKATDYDEEKTDLFVRPGVTRA